MSAYRDNAYIYTCFARYKIPFMKDEINKLIKMEENENKEIHNLLADEFHKSFKSKWGALPSYHSGMSDSQCDRIEKEQMRRGDLCQNYITEGFRHVNVTHKDVYIQTYSYIIFICDKTFKFIQDLYLDGKKNQEIHTFILSNLINTYTRTKESCNAIDSSSLKSEFDWIDKTLPLIRILYKEYTTFLDYQRLVTFQQKAKLTDEEAFSILYYLIHKNLTSFYLNISKYTENTLLVKKVMNRFSKEHGIRPEDVLEVFQEYIGDGEESKNIMEHEFFPAKVYSL
jgi:hypothetical protein